MSFDARDFSLAVGGRAARVLPRGGEANVEKVEALARNRGGGAGIGR